MRHFHCSLSMVSQVFVLEKMVSTTVFYPVSQHHRRKQSIIKWKCVPPSCNHWEYWGGVEDSASSLFLQTHEKKTSGCDKTWPSELDFLLESKYTNDCLCGNICEHVHICKMVVMVVYLHTSLRRTGEHSVLPECSVLWIKAVAVYSCVMVSLLRPSAVDNVINNILLSKQHLTEECCSSTLCMDTLLHWGIKGLLPFVPGLNPRSRSVYAYKPVLVCMHVREMMMSTSFSLGLLKGFSTWCYEVTVWTFTFWSWDLHGDK